MGKIAGIRMLFIAAAVYMVVVNAFPGNDSRHILTEQGEIPAAQEVCVSADLPFISDFALTEGNLIVVAGGPVSCSSKQWHTFKAVILASEIKVVQFFRQIVFEVIYFPVRLTRPVLLFPFHYFF